MSVKDVTSLAHFLTQDQLGPWGCFPFSWEQDWQLQDLLLLHTKQSFRAAPPFLHFQPWWWIWCLKPNFLLSWTSTKTNPRKPVAFFITSEELLQQLLTILGQILFLKTTHPSLQEKPNDFFLLQAHISLIQIREHILCNNNTINKIIPAHHTSYC